MKTRLIASRRMIAQLLANTSNPEDIDTILAMRAEIETLHRRVQTYKLKGNSKITYEEFVANMNSVSPILSPEAKEQFRWAAKNHFDYLWRYMTEEVPEAAGKVECLGRLHFDAEPL